MIDTGEQRCPFCGGTYRATTDDDGHHVQHTLPMCSKFEQLDALDFLTAAREARGILLDN